MRATVLYAPHDVRVEDRPDPKIEKPTDAIIRLAATCVCGSDLWPYRGIEAVDGPTPMGHEYVGIVEEVGSEVRTIKPGQFVIGSFFASDNTCEICEAGYQSRCVHAEVIGAIGTQAQYARIPLADGTLVATPGIPADDLVPSLLAASDVLGTGWFGAVAAEAGPRKTVAVVGDGAVGLLGVLAAHQLGAERIVIVSRHEARQALAREFGATDVIVERGDEGVARVKELTGGLGAGASVPPGTDRADLQSHHQPREGVRPRTAARAGRRGLPRDGRPPDDQDAAAPVNLRPEQENNFMNGRPAGPTARGSQNLFTGEVWIDHITTGHEPAPAVPRQCALHPRPPCPALALLRPDPPRDDMTGDTQPSAAQHMIGDFAHKLVSLTDDVLFADVWERSELSPRDRSLVTITALIAGGNTEQLPFHLDLGKRNGLSDTEIVEAITHRAFYCSWPKAMSASTVAKQELTG